MHRRSNAVGLLPRAARPWRGAARRLRGAGAAGAGRLDGVGARRGQSAARHQRHVLWPRRAPPRGQRFQRHHCCRRQGERGSSRALGARGGVAGTRRHHLRVGRFDVLDRVRLWRCRQAHAGRDDIGDCLARPRREPDHVLGRRPALRVAVRTGPRAVRDRSGRRRRAAPHHRRTRSRLRPQRHGLGSGRPALRSAADGPGSDARGCRSRYVRIRRHRLSGAGRAEVRFAESAARARQRHRRGVPSGHRDGREAACRPNRAERRQPGLRRGRPALRVELCPQFHPRGARTRGEPHGHGRRPQFSRAVWPGCPAAAARAACFWPTAAPCANCIPRPARKSATWSATTPTWERR